MKPIEFISNNKNKSHQQYIVDLMNNADELWIASAFLKSTGLNLLLPSIKKLIAKKAAIHFIVGQNFALTEPKALDELRRLFLNKPFVSLYLAQANSASSIFHPKLAIIRKQNKIFIVCGSANITGGGLTNNVEASLSCSATTSDDIYKSTLSFFNDLFLPENSEEVTLLTVKKYETFYEKQKKHNRSSKAIPDKTQFQKDFNYAKLLAFFRSYDNKERQQIYNDKLVNYKQARKVLDQIADSPDLREKTFAALLDSLVGSAEDYSLWHSGSLYRLRRKVYPYYKEFRSLVKHIRSNINADPSEIFISAKEKVKPISGASINYITEIMMTYSPEKFANLNKNPITVLRTQGNLYIKASSESFNGEDYKEYCEIVNEICLKLGLRDMLEADSFFNDIYWKIQNK